MGVFGGWSYDGIAHSFSYEGWDVIGSRALSFQWGENRFAQVGLEAFRPTLESQVGQDFEPRPSFQRGDPLVPVVSCFGGLAIYRMGCLSAAEYGGDACEQVGFHKRLRQAGFSQIFLNPSQITLHSPT
jgi:hypothetical protein